MSSICTYAHARARLDDAIYRLRKTIEATVVKMEAAAWERVDGTFFTNDAIRGMAAGYQEAAHRLAYSAWLTGRAALVGLIRTQRTRLGKTVRVASRNARARGGSGKRKAFPSDGHARPQGKGARGKGKRARYSSRWIGTQKKINGVAKGLPKLASLSEHRVGRPEVPTAYRIFRRKLARGKQLEKARVKTAAKRKAKGWKSYPYPRKITGEAKGWSDFSAIRYGANVLGLKIAEVRKINITHLRHETEARRKKWEAKHDG